MSVKYAGGELYADGRWRVTVAGDGWESVHAVSLDSERLAHESLVCVSMEPDAAVPSESDLRYAGFVATSSRSLEEYRRAMEDAHDPT